MAVTVAHEHPVYDTDKHFVIDPITRKITTLCQKVVLPQHSKNSERFTFEIPKEVEGHDMSACNLVEIHYQNIEAANKANKSIGIYEVKDLQADGDTVTGSWLIDGDATYYVGGLMFAMHFACVADDGTVEYNLPTLSYSDITIGETVWNSEIIAKEYPDIIANFEARIQVLEKGGATDEQIAAAVEDYMAEHPIEVPESSGGLSSTASALLITILRNGVFNTDQSANITALANALASGESGDNSPDEGGESDGEGETHTHSYTATVTTAATCETAGVRTYTCSCGESYTEEIPATGHNYVDGVCSVCGAADPDWEEAENNGWTDGEAYEIEWTDGYALDNSGAEVENANMSVSGFLPCQGASRMVTANLSSNYLLWYYDADKNFLRKAPTSYVVNQTNIETCRDACFVRTTKRLATANASVTPYLDDLLDASTPWEAGKFYRLNWTDGIAINATTGAEAANANSAASALALCYGAATLQFSNAARSFITWYDSDKQFISQETRQNVTTAVSVPDGACYFRISNSSIGSGCNFWAQLS